MRALVLIMSPCLVLVATGCGSQPVPSEIYGPSDWAIGGAGGDVGGFGGDGGAGGLDGGAGSGGGFGGDFGGSPGDGQGGSGGDPGSVGAGGSTGGTGGSGSTGGGDQEEPDDEEVVIASCKQVALDICNDFIGQLYTRESVQAECAGVYSPNPCTDPSIGRCRYFPGMLLEHVTHYGFAYPGVQTKSTCLSLGGIWYNP